MKRSSRGDEKAQRKQDGRCGGRIGCLRSFESKLVLACHGSDNGKAEHIEVRLMTVIRQALWGINIRITASTRYTVISLSHSVLRGLKYLPCPYP